MTQRRRTSKNQGKTPLWPQSLSDRAGVAACAGVVPAARKMQTTSASGQERPRHPPALPAGEWRAVGELSDWALLDFSTEDTFRAPGRRSC